MVVAQHPCLPTCFVLLLLSVLQPLLLAMVSTYTIYMLYEIHLRKQSAMRPHLRLSFAHSLYSLARATCSLLCLVIPTLCSLPLRVMVLF